MCDCKELKNAMDGDSIVEFLGYGEYEGEKGVWAKDKLTGENMHISSSVMDGVDPMKIVVGLHEGRNIEQMTRVTGYFSRSMGAGGKAGWNAGKMGELADRSRVNLGA